MVTNKMQLFWLIYLFLISSICFGRFLRPSSGALDCIYGIWYCPPVSLLAGVMDEIELHGASCWSSFTITIEFLPLSEKVFRDVRTKICKLWWLQQNITYVFLIKYRTHYKRQKCCQILRALTQGSLIQGQNLKRNGVRPDCWKNVLLCVRSMRCINTFALELDI
jgi:hypothetical protein